MKEGTIYVKEGECEVMVNGVIYKKGFEGDANSAIKSCIARYFVSKYHHEKGHKKDCLFPCSMEKDWKNNESKLPIVDLRETIGNQNVQAGNNNPTA